MTFYSLYLTFLMTLVAISTLAIAFYSRKSYNVLVMGVTQIKAPARAVLPQKVDTIRIAVNRDEVSTIYPRWKNAGYNLVRSSTDHGVMTLTLTKTLNGDSA
jgi:hypothetical protein